MEHDSHALALTVSSTALVVHEPSEFWKVFPKLPQAVRNEVSALLPLMREIGSSRKTRPAIAAVAARTNRAAETLKRWFYRFSKAGPAGLVDHRKCGGCGLDGCTKEREAAIPADVIQRWRKDAITSDKNALSESWKAIIRDLAAGKAVEDAGTWRDLFAVIHPYREPPAQCPWSLHRPPPGWSLSSFLLHKVPDVVYALAQKGSFEAWQYLPEVRVDLSGLRPFEWLVVDDHRLDFKVFVDVPGRGVQLVELWGLFVMDVATRMIVAFALKPRIEREDGSFVAFEHRDMQHLIFHVLSTYGIPEGYDMTWIVENAAAAVSRETEGLVTFVSKGRVKIKRTGIQVGDFTLSGFPERWGNYRGKRWLEVWFSALDIILGGVKGQMGSDYWAKPGSFDARQAFGNRLLKLLEKCTPEVRAKLALPFEWAGAAHWLIAEAIELLNHRQDHELEGFEEIRFFAYDVTSAMIPIHPQLAALHGLSEHLEAFTAVPDNLKTMWLANGGRPRRMMPAEKMALNLPRMQSISREAMIDLLFDEVVRWKKDPLTYKGGNVLDIEVRRGREKLKLRFSGFVPGLEIGARIIARVNYDHIECGAWILDEKRRVLGHMPFEGDPTYDDVDKLHRMLGAQISAVKEATGITELITNDRRTSKRRIGELAELEQTVNTLKADTSAGEIAAAPESQQFAKAVASVRRNTAPRADRTTLRDLRKQAAS